jgi:DNA-binding response OmpR family regulator
MEWKDPPGPHGLCIWVAEDDDELREILTGALSREGREVRAFKEGQEVLKAIPNGSFDLLITDLVMPGADGIQILSDVRKSHPERLVIIITGYASIDSAIQAIRGGAYDYLRKPFTLEQLEIIVKNGAEKIFLTRENEYLIRKLKESMEEINRLKAVWEEHVTEMLGIYSKIGPDQRLSEIEFILNQLNPAPPDRDLERRPLPEKTLPALEKLIQFKKEGLLNEEEFSHFKKVLLDKLN